MKPDFTTSIDRRTALGLIAASAALPLCGNAASAQSATTIRVAYIPFESSAQLFYAKELGLWTRAGLDVQLQPNPFGAAIAAGVASNAIDIGYATVMTLAAAHAKHIPFTIIAAANAFDAKAPPNGMLVSANPAVRTGKDLNGKIIGSPGLNTLGEYGVRAWVDANGGDASTLRFVEVPFSDMAGALATGRIDAAYVAEPFLSGAEKAGHAVTIEFDAIAKSFLIAGWFTTSDWAKAHPDAVTRFAGTIVEATDWALKNPAKCPEIVAKYLKMEPAQIAATPRATFARGLNAAQVQPGIDLTARYAKFPAFSAQELIAQRP